MKPTSNKTRGFSMVELMVAMAVGLIVMSAAAQLFKSGMDTTMMITQQAEMQQNVRAALNLIAKDVSMAGAGMPPGGVNLPYGTGYTASRFGCNQTPTCYVNTNSYTTGTLGTPASTVTNFMYGLIPGPSLGMEKNSWTATVPSTGATPDRVTSVYVDYSFPLSDYSVTIDSTGTFATLGATPATDPAILSATGLKVGDLILMENSLGSAVGEITTVTATRMSFANADALNINQTGATSGRIRDISAGASTKAYRLLAITYFLEVPTTASGLTPRLMRQVNGQNPLPVADNIIDLQITYDACDNTNTPTGGPAPTCAALPDPIGNTPSYSPNQIHKVNIQVIGQSVLSAGTNKSRSMALVTSVSTRNLSFTDRFK
jgi:prepilin-type N-terminal cleavage/methylation domain-containing protein